MRRRSARVAGLLVSLILAPAVSLGAQANASLETALRRLPRLGTIAYVTAHPDDEGAAIITYLARGLHARVVILCVTRGEGGQNLTGPELGEELAQVRTQELARAAAGYGAEVRFLGAEDFGYSKSLEETFKIWNEEKTLGALVRELRSLRPLAVISHWRGTERDGSAHHRAAGLLTRHAFALAGDAAAFPEQFAEGLQPWQPRYLLVRAYSNDDGNAMAVPVERPSPVAGKTYEELGWEAFQNHRSQGLHLIQLSQISFRRRYYLRVEATLRNGPPAPVSVSELSPDLAALPDLFPAVELLQQWRTRLVQVVGLAEDSRRLLGENKTPEAALALVQGAGLLTALRREIPEDTTEREPRSLRGLLDERQKQFLGAAATIAGARLEAFTDRATATPGEQIWVGLAVRVGSPAVLRATGFTVGALRLDTPAGWHVEPLVAETTTDLRQAEFLVSIPENLDPRRVAPVPLRARAALTTGSLQLELTAPVQGLVRGPGQRPGLLEQFDPRRLLRPREHGIEEEEAKADLEPVRVTPAVTLRVVPLLRLLPAPPGETTREWCIELQAHRPQVGKISTWFEVPMGWYTPAPQETELELAGQEARLCFPLTLPGRTPPGRYELGALAGRGIKTFALAREQRFPDTREATYHYEPAHATLQVLDIRVPAGLRVGYVGFNHDPVPALLAQLGVTVDLLDEEALARARLEDYDSVLIATRAYDYRPDLAGATPRLLDYIQRGGTLVVEHQGRRWDPSRFAPYPAEKPPSRNLRVTDETAAVRVLAPTHPVLNFPNPIGQEDWADWVQERGLYFWESWSGGYTPLVEIADPAEKPLRGSLLSARYGEGVYIYCGLALFRQVRAGVPGGVRLYVNLLSQGRAVPATASTNETPEE